MTAPELFLYDLVSAPFARVAVGWLLTYALHSSVLLIAAWAASRALRGRRLALEEGLWRVAVLGALVTATLQLTSTVQPVAGEWTVAAPAVERGTDGEVGAGSAGEPMAGTWAAPASRNLDASPAGVLAAPTALSPAAATIPEIALPATPPLPAGMIHWSVPVVWLWACGALLCGLPLILAFVALSRRLRFRRSLTEGPAASTLARLAQRRGAPRRTRLTTTESLSVPIALGLRRPEICLPARATELAAAEQESLVAHEMAHLVRRDPLWLVALRLLEAVFFFQPLLRLARRRLEAIAEFRCDDWARRQTGRPTALARCLTEVAGWTLGEASPKLVPGIVGRRSGLAQRVERLLAPSAGDRSAGRLLVATAAAALVLTVLLAPSVRLEAGSDGPRSSTHETWDEPAEGPADEPGDDNGGWAIEDGDEDDWMARQEAREARLEGQLENLEIDLGDLDLDLDLENLELGELIEPEVLQGLTELAALKEISGMEGLARLEALEGLDLTDSGTFDALERLTGLELSFDFDFEGVDFDFEPFEMAELADAFDEEHRHHHEELAERVRELVEESAAFDAVQMEALAERARAIAERSQPDPAAVERLQRLAMEIAERSQPDPEAIERLQRQARRIAESHQPDHEEIERLQREAHELAERYRPDPQEIERLQREARELAERHRPDPEEIERLRREARELAERHRVDPEEMEHLRREAREIAREHSMRQREVQRELREQVQRQEAVQREARRQAHREMHDQRQGSHEAQRRVLEERRRQLEEQQRALEREVRRLERESERLEAERLEAERLEADGGG